MSIFFNDGRARGRRAGACEAMTAKAPSPVILGHASIRTTQIYGHLAPDHISGATAILEGSDLPKSTHGQCTGQ